MAQAARAVSRRPPAASAPAKPAASQAAADTAARQPERMALAETAGDTSAATVAGALGNVHLAVYRGPLTVLELTKVHTAHLALLVGVPL